MNGNVFSVEELKSFADSLLSKYWLRGTKLFGSYARSEAKDASDIDLIIDGGDDFRALLVYDLAEDLCMVTGKDVDASEVSEIGSGPFREDSLLRIRYSQDRDQSPSD